jgi:hypothetical protein
MSIIRIYDKNHLCTMAQGINARSKNYWLRPSIARICSFYLIIPKIHKSRKLKVGLLFTAISATLGKWEMEG